MAQVRDDPRLTFIHGDSCDPIAVRAALAECDALVHTAAETHMNHSNWATRGLSLGIHPLPQQL